MKDIKSQYESYYNQNYLGKANGRHCYPVEFVVRPFLGSSYPQLKINRDYQGKKILDLGCGEGHYRLTSDPLSLRNGSQFRVFESKDEIIQVFSPLFEDFSIGHCAEDYHGFFQSMWIACMKRKDQ